MKNNFNSKILNMIVILGISITCILLLGTGFITTAFFKSQFSLIDHSLVISVTICIYLCAIPYIIALFGLKRLCSLVVKNNPFSMQIVKSLKVISICSFSEIIIFIGCVNYLKHSVEFFKYTVWGAPIIALTIICLTIGFLCLVLSQLFKIAIKIKEENDKTI
ncbi:DUF2975 domain-containing protein [Tepidibacter aestuarii]|uniref:DUF2975 domain-containing protein n=1 Tax=Tepidibacter aestuarii TaxID=2925782 RepID=UPI0020BEFA0E|nr:DUF2975 domain-containing protein [Tepidibacter aestuarii]CAH2215408.1 DUF2975 domain-containing protein [Tepidibacter aestuarii]